MKMWMRRCVLGVLWILSLVLISFYGGAVSYGFFFGVTLIPVISLVYLFCVYHRFKIYQETGRREIVCGRPEPYFFVLENEDLFAFTSVSVKMHSFFSYVEDSFENVEYELLPGDRITCETRIVCKYRGEYEVGVKEVVVTDLFRLFRFTYTVSGQIKAVAAPRVVQLEELRSIQDLPVLLQREAAGASEPDILVRDYVEGDSLKQIHWKATAREGKLKVRVLTGRENQSLYLFCETKRYGETAREYLPLENKLLEVFLAVSFFFAEKNREFYACFGQGGAVRERVDGMGTFQKLYEKVKEIEFGKEDLGDVMTQVLERNSLGSGAVFVVLHELKPEILEITERLTVGGTMVVLYLVTDEVTGASPASWADARGSRASGKVGTAGEGAASRTDARGNRASGKVGMFGEGSVSRADARGNRASGKVGMAGEGAVFRADARGNRASGKDGTAGAGVGVGDATEFENARRKVIVIPVEAELEGRL